MEDTMLIKTGKSFPFSIQLFAWVFLLMPFYGLIANESYSGLIFSVIALAIITARTGIIFQPKHKKMKVYNSFYGIKLGKWSDYKKYPYISVLSTKATYALQSRASTSLNSDTYFDICLLSASHRSKLMLLRIDNKEKAIEKARLYAQELGLELTAYQPQVSAQSKSRR